MKLLIISILGKLSLGLCFSFLAMTIAVAQTVLEEVVVTLQKRTESLQDVLIAVTAFTSEAIQNMEFLRTMTLQTYPQKGAT